MERCGLNEFEEDELGVQIRYQRGGLKADVCLYDAGQFRCPDDIKSPTVTRQFADSLGSIEQAVELGLYLEFDLITLDRWTFSYPSCGREFLHAELLTRSKQSDFSADVGMETSHLLLTTVAGFFLKVRVTHPTDGDYGQPECVKAFLTDLLTKLNS